MIKPLIIVVLIVAIVLGGVFGWQAFIGSMIKKYMGAAATAPQTVSTVTAVATTWQAQIQAVGTLRAVRGADLSAQASGVVDDIEFDSGNDVPAGKLLLRLKPNDDFAKLEQLQAAAELAEQTFKRDQEQFAAQAISQATIDTDAATLKSARAQVAAQQALIEEKIVKAPFAGRLGIRQVDVGQYLAAGTTVVTLQALDPILIDFYVPQQALAHIKIGQAAAAAIDTYPGANFQGSIESINSKVDTASRNVQVRASFRQCGPAAGARHVRECRGRVRRGDPADHPAANGHHLQPVRRHGLSRAARRRHGSRTRCSSASSSSARRAAIRSPFRAASMRAMWW